VLIQAGALAAVYGALALVAILRERR
jgi:hypothetical protein